MPILYRWPYVTQSDKTSLIARKYTHVYNYIYLLFCVWYSNSVSFIKLLRSFCIHGEACAKILCSEKELLNLKDSKLTQNFYGNKTGFVRPGHTYIFYTNMLHIGTGTDINIGAPLVKLLQQV